jgi:hypothetical protein
MSMKSYTLRLDDEVLDALKHIGIIENKTVREIVLECIEKRISRKLSEGESLKEQREMEKAAKLLTRLPTQKVIESIRKEREK